MKHDTLAPEIYQHALEFLRIGNEAVRKTREENRKLGIPNVFAVNGQLCWDLDARPEAREPHPLLGGPAHARPQRCRRSRRR